MGFVGVAGATRVACGRAIGALTGGHVVPLDSVNQIPNIWDDRYVRKACGMTGPINWYQSQVQFTMGTNKERIEHLEAGLGEVQEGLHRRELGMADRLRHVEETLNRLSDVLLANQEPPNQGRFKMKVESCRGSILKRNSGRVLGHQTAKTLTRLICIRKRVPCVITNGIEQLGNRVKGWTQKALVGTFMGGLKIEISDGIRMRVLRPAPPLRALPVLPPRNQRQALGSTDRVGRKCNDDVSKDDNNVIYDEVNEERNTGRHQEENLEPEITLHALTGWSAPKTMRVAARIGDHDVIILIDSGSTHNFTSERLANFVITGYSNETFPFGLPMENLLNVKEGLDVVLGIQWLELLGVVVTELALLHIIGHSTPQPLKIDFDTNRDDMLDELHGAVFYQTRSASYHQSSKCAFGQQELEYLGHIITSQGVKVDDNKIAAMFVKNYGIIARPLTNLLKKGQFGWHEEAERAFLALKRAMTTTPILAMPNFNESFTIETDASGEGIGAVLSQCGKPVAYMSRALGVAKKSWSTYAKEMLAIIEAIRTWRPYLLGRNSIFDRSM
ncbi:hypothetical protein AAG906_016015 [Vitis piasezkii]